MCESGNEQGPVTRSKAGSPKDCNRIVKQKTRNTDKALRKVDLGKGRRDEKRKGARPEPIVCVVNRTRDKGGGTAGAERSKRPSGGT